MRNGIHYKRQRVCYLKNGKKITKINSKYVRDRL